MGEAMEFFAEADACCDVRRLQQMLTIAALPRYCSEISQLLRDGMEEGEIYCLWGSFTVHREEIGDGVRFTLPNCPNALAWTVTCEGAGRILVHCTINKRDPDADFIESIESFVAAWKKGLERHLGPR